VVLARRWGERRSSTYTDWCEATRLCDALDEIGMFWSPVVGGRRDDSVAGCVDYLADTQRAFSKHVQDSFDDPAEAPWVLETLEVVFGGRDAVRRVHPYSFLVCPVSPLILEASEVDAWLGLRGYDIPVAVMPMPLMGGTAPASMLATVLLGNCEVLGTLCLVQAAEPGTPFIHAPTLATMDPRSGRLEGGTAHGAMSVAAVEMARFYGLPAMGSGPASDHFVPGIQAGYEKGVATLFSTLAWPDILVGPGTLAEASVFSFEQTLIDVEIWRLCRKAHEGVVVADDRWLVDVLEKVGPGGQFLSDKSTRRNARSGEWHYAQLGRHESYGAWTAAGRPDVLDEAREAVDELLATHEPLPLGDEVEKGLAELRARAGAES
jgi:trimethylamine--corrinoid protein Co-methyltransferase